MTKISELTIKKKNPKRFELLASSQFNVLALGLVVLALSVIGYFLVVRSMGASTSLYLAPPSIAVSPGESLVVAVRLSTPEQVKIVRANLKYPTDKFDYIGINSSDSAFPVDAGVKGGGGNITVTRTAASGSTVTGDQLVFKINLKAKSAVGVASVTFVTGSAAIRSSDNVNVLAGTSSGTYAVSAQAGPIGSNTASNANSNSTSTNATPADGSVSDPSALDANSGSSDGLAVEPTKAKPSVLVWILIGLGAAVGLAGLAWVTLKFVLPWLKSRRGAAANYDFMQTAVSQAAPTANIGVAVAPIAPVAVGQPQSVLNQPPQPAFPSQPTAWQPKAAPIASYTAPNPAVSQPMPAAIPPNPPFAAQPQPMVNVVQPADVVTPNPPTSAVIANISQSQSVQQPVQIAAEPYKMAPISVPVVAQPPGQEAPAAAPAPTMSSPPASSPTPTVPPATT